eukprot:TRINITY_DN5061_c0_g1_i3.p1 TRINITY_DN5061_c0_g1~~TRINITY_DN5061_c0_g1_i3.p1  ORF type:complete len:975 (-),score=102.89 TRINITY_DN5061_c0_g1_i3:1065-3989(-)
MSLNQSAANSGGKRDVETGKSVGISESYPSEDPEKLEKFLPVKVKEGPYVLNTFQNPKSTHEIFHEHPEWEGAPVTQEEVKKNLDRIKKMAAYESLDFDYIDSDLERERDLHRHHGDYFQVYFWRWFICVLIGFVMGVIAFVVDWAVETLNDVKYSVTDRMVRSPTDFWQPFLVYLAFSVVFCAISGSLVSFVSPLAAGSGIPELKTYLNGIHIRGLLKLKTLAAKLVGIVFTIAGGLIAGKEGPFVHGGGIVGGGLGAMGSKTLNVRLPREWGGAFRNYPDHRDFVAIGTAAGVSVAFSAPVGGLLFAIEEGASFYSTSVFWRGFLATCTAVGTMHYLAGIYSAPGQTFYTILGVNRDFGMYNDIVADYGQVYHYYMWELPIFIVMGVGGGLLGAFFVWLNQHITRFRYKYIPVTKPVKRLIEVIVMAIITSVIFFMISYLSPCAALPSNQIIEIVNLRNGTEAEIASARFYQTGGNVEYFPQLWCPKGQYNVHGQLFATPLASSLRLIIHMGENFPMGQQWIFPFVPVFLMFVVVYVLMTITYGVGAPQGLFVPSLMVGACVGRLIGQLMWHIVKVKQWTGIYTSLPTYAIIGASASLGGATRMTLSITVLVMETTGALEIIVPIMITVFFAKIVGDALNYGIYDTHIKLRGTPLLDEFQLEAHQRMLADKLQVGELVPNQRIIALPPVVPVHMLLDALRNCTHATFPVTDELDHIPGQAPVAHAEFELHGVVWRGMLMKMIDNRLGFFRPDAEGNFPDSNFFIPNKAPKRYQLIECLEEIPMKMRLKEEQEEVLTSLTEEIIKNFYVDLRPFMRRHPYLMHEDAPLSRAYRLYRTMGLRQIFVISRPRVRGLITRKDIVEDNAMLQLGSKAHHGTIKMSKSQRDLFTNRNKHEVPIVQFEPYYLPEEHQFAYEHSMIYEDESIYLDEDNQLEPVKEEEDKRPPSAAMSAPAGHDDIKKPLLQASSKSDAGK